MTREGFLKRLSEGSPVNCTWNSAETEGLISAWMHNGQFILTWEECRPGTQHDEHAYSRDERMVFSSPQEVLAFVERNGHPASAFGP